VKSIHREVVFPHPPERVWKALTDPRILGMWLMEADGFEPRVGCRFRFRTKPAPGFDGIIHCVVIDAEPPSRLTYTWASGKQRSTTVRWQLHPHSDGTRLVLDHDGFGGVAGWVLKTMLGRGWGHKLRDYMPLLLERLAATADNPDGISREGLLECASPRT
jgi:uncharacterized protein YndB with AHSA1/START domain